MRGRQPVTAKQSSFPVGVTEADKKYPKKGYIGSMEFLQSNRFGWCVKTLPINGRGRSYGMSAEGTVVTMGGRPDDQPLYIYIHEGNQARLQKWIDLKAKGVGTAGDIRDRIGSRRAQGQVMRAQGRSSWRWND
jgi:hypothetical protein